MFKNIISMPEVQYLGFGIMMPWENNLEMQFNFWEEAFSSGKVEELKRQSGSEQVVGIFCYKCDMEIKQFSYHIACENKLNALSPEFENLTLKPLNFACFESNCMDIKQKFKVYNDLCDEIWGQWLPDSEYISLIEPETFGCTEGYGMLERYTPEEMMKGLYSVEMLLPVKRK